MRSASLAVAVAAIVVASAGYLVGGDTSLGSAPDAGRPDWLKIGGVLAGVGGGPLFAVWYAWYMTAKRIPDIEKTHTDEVKAKDAEHKEVLTSLHKTHADHVNLLTTNYRADMNIMWTQKREDDRALMSAIKELTEAVREAGACRYRETA